MLDDYKEVQNIFYRIVKNSLTKSKCSHAYLIESNGYPYSFELSFSLAKALLCPNNYTNLLNCNCCNQCSIIDDGNFLELKIIRPDGEWIKKEQLEELQNLFSKKAIIGNKKVYIIDKVEKLNRTSANSILKFLEEPEDGIVAILITENINNVLNTIVSRCQVLSLKKSIDISDKSFVYKIGSNIFNSENDINIFIENDNTISNINSVIEFINYYEDYHLDTLLEIDSLWNNYFKERSEILICFEIMLLYYKDILNYLMNNPLDIFLDYKKNIQKISIKNSLLSITKKIQVIMDLKEKIKYNVNTNLLMDKLILNLEGCEDVG